jgi:hypothetical protein
MYRAFFVLCGQEDAVETIGRLIEIYDACAETDYLPFGLITYPTAGELATSTIAYAAAKKRYFSELRSALPILI